MPHTTPFDQFAAVTARGWFSGAAFVLRLALGFLFFHSAWAKFSADAWSAAGYLSLATGPLTGWFQSLAGNPIVDALNLYGQAAIGLALIFGCLVRPASIGGVFLMVLYYLAHFEQNTAYGLVDQHVVYALVFLFFASGGFGHLWGIDGLIARQPSLQRKRWVNWLFG
ncbi:DoxX family membrane protein [Candidatus Parcubacteria bacterium]|nr:DoxX family membrane protein [Candidatus Parcubacteria bacterium]